MKTQLDKIYQQKNQKKKNLQKIRNEIIASVYKDIINEKKIPEITKKIKRIREKSKSVGLLDDYIFVFGIGLAHKLTHTVRANKPVDKAEFIIDYLQKKHIFENSKSIINKEINNIEAEDKDQLLKETLKDARRNDRIFFLASQHDDCAADHKDYQGKLYYDNKAKLTQEEREFIQANKIQSFQWVTFRPVWLITRPNCRHYFKALRTEDVLTHSIGQLIRNHRMHHKKGKYEMQTVRYKSAEETLKAYKERLAYHEYLYAQYKTETLRKLIQKDKLLIKKWEDYLKRL